MSATSRSAQPPAGKTVLIVDDHPMLRRGLAALIESEPGLGVCGEAASCTAALAAIRRHSPDLVIVDLALEGSDGLDLIKEMAARHPGFRRWCSRCTTRRCTPSARCGPAPGATSPSRQLDDTVLVAIRRMLAGETYMSDRLTARLASKNVGGRTLETESALNALSDRELEVFRLIGQGRGTRQIAEALNLSVKTIESHREHIKQKLRLASATELAHRATQWVESGHPG